MEGRARASLFFGLLAGMLSAVTIIKYEKYSETSDAPYTALRDKNYATGGTSFYFVSLERRNEYFGIGDPSEIVDREKHREGEEIDKWLGRDDYSDDSKINKRSKRHLSGTLSGDHMCGDPTLLEPDLLAIISAPSFDPYLDASLLQDKVRVICMVTLEQRYVDQYGKSIQNTWSRHCNKVIIASNVEQGDIINLDLKEGSMYAWSRARTTLIYAHDEFAEQYDWFVYVPYNGFVVVENLQYLLLMHKANVPGYMGHMFEGPNGGGYVYVLSQDALKHIRPYLPSCAHSYFGGSKDGEVLESCFKSADVIASMSGLDVNGDFRFQMIMSKPNLPVGAITFRQWYWQYIVHPELQGPECCKDYSISFHHVDPNDMYLLEYMIYHMRPFGIGTYRCPEAAGSKTAEDTLRKNASVVEA